MGLSCEQAAPDSNNGAKQAAQATKLKGLPEQGFLSAKVCNVLATSTWALPYGSAPPYGLPVQGFHAAWD